MPTWIATRLSCLGAAAAITLAATTLAYAESGPFAGLGGTWNGRGQIALASGSKERIHCRATYAVADDGNALQQSLRCASDSYNFELRSDVNSQGGAVSGAWNELTRNVGGTLSGHARRGHVDVTVNSPAFNANLTLVSHGDRQSVTIRSQGGEFVGATIALTRSTRSVNDR